MHAGAVSACRLAAAVLPRQQRRGREAQGANAAGRPGLQVKEDKPSDVEKEHMQQLLLLQLLCSARLCGRGPKTSRLVIPDNKLTVSRCSRGSG